MPSSAPNWEEGGSPRGSPQPCRICCHRQVGLEGCWKDGRLLPGSVVGLLSKGEVFLCCEQSKKTIVSQRTNSSGLEKDQGEGEMRGGDGEERGERGDRASAGGLFGDS